MMVVNININESISHSQKVEEYSSEHQVLTKVCETQSKDLQRSNVMEDFYSDPTANFFNFFMFCASNCCLYLMI